jgi:hypothetical protein
MSMAKRRRRGSTKALGGLIDIVFLAMTAVLTIAAVFMVRGWLAGSFPADWGSALVLPLAGFSLAYAFHEYVAGTGLYRLISATAKRAIIAWWRNRRTPQGAPLGRSEGALVALPEVTPVVVGPPASEAALRGRDFERQVSTLFRCLGYTDLRVSGGGGDRGADIWCRDPLGASVIVQCKAYSSERKVTGGEVTHLLGAIQDTASTRRSW